MVKWLFIKYKTLIKCYKVKKWIITLVPTTNIILNSYYDKNDENNEVYQCLQSLAISRNLAFFQACFL